MGKFLPGESQATRARRTPPTLSYLGDGPLIAAEAHSVICSPFSETSFLPQLSDTDHSLGCSEGKHPANPTPGPEGVSHVPIHSCGAASRSSASLASLVAKGHGSGIS